MRWLGPTRSSSTTCRSRRCRFRIAHSAMRTLIPRVAGVPSMIAPIVALGLSIQLGDNPVELVACRRTRQPVAEGLPLFTTPPALSGLRRRCSCARFSAVANSDFTAAPNCCLITVPICSAPTGRSGALGHPLMYKWTGLDAGTSYNLWSALRADLGVGSTTTPSAGST